MITERLKSVMSSIVHRDQTCSVPGRSIFLIVRDLLDMIDKTNETGILLTLDQEKAFDQVDHEFLMHTLTKFRFGPIFCQWVSLFYNRVFSPIICNGNLTQPIFLGRGVRQGCPLSPLLYVLVSQGLSTQIRECSQVIGFHLPGAGGLHFTFSSFVCHSWLWAGVWCQAQYRQVRENVAWAVAGQWCHPLRPWMGQENENSWGFL